MAFNPFKRIVIDTEEMAKFIQKHMPNLDLQTIEKVLYLEEIFLIKKGVIKDDREYPL